MQITVIAPTTDAVETNPQINSQAYASVTISCDDAMVSTEVIVIYIATGAGWAEAKDKDGNRYELTADVSHLNLIGGPIYSVEKDETVSPVGVYATFQRAS